MARTVLICDCIPSPYDGHDGRDDRREPYMADENRGYRPLSPHLQIYRPQWTSMTSIFVRMAGNALLISARLVVWWLAALVRGQEAYGIANGVLSSWFGDLVMFLSVGGIWY